MALATGPAKNTVALMLALILRALAAHYHIAILLARVPRRVYPADSPSGNTELSLGAGPKKKLATVGERFSARDLSWVPQRAG